VRVFCRVYFLQAGCCCRLHLAAQQLSSWHKSHARQVILMYQKDVKLEEARVARGRSWLYCIREIRNRSTEEVAFSLVCVNLQDPACLSKRQVLGIRDIFVRILGLMDPDPDPTPFFGDFKDAKNYFVVLYFSLITYLQTHRLKKFCIILFCKLYFSPLNTFMRKGKVSDPDPGGPSPTLKTTFSFDSPCIFVFVKSSSPFRHGLLVF
jgi:hypothetical protein